MWVWKLIKMWHYIDVIYAYQANYQNDDEDTSE